MSTIEQVDAIGSREEFVAYVRALTCSLHDEPATWEHRDLDSYLNALAAWVEDMDGYSRNRNDVTPEQPSWKVLAQMLTAARVYE
jgi:hypothetical protein